MKHLKLMLGLLCLCLPTPSHALIKLTDQDKIALLNYARLTYDNNFPKLAKFQFPASLDKIPNDLIIAVFGGDGTLWALQRFGDNSVKLSKKISDGVRELHSEVIKRKSRSPVTPTIKKFSNLNKKYEYDGDYIHLMLLKNKKPYQQVKGLDFFNPGNFTPAINGLVIQRADGFSEITPFDAIVLNLTLASSIKSVERHLKISTEELLYGASFSAWTYEVIHFGENLPDRRLANYGQGIKLEPSPVATEQELKTRLQWIAHWYLKNVTALQVNDHYAPSILKAETKSATPLTVAQAIWQRMSLATLFSLQEMKGETQVMAQTRLQTIQTAVTDLASNKNLTHAEKAKIKNKLKHQYSALPYLILALNEVSGISPLEMNKWLSWLKKYQNEDGSFQKIFGERGEQRGIETYLGLIELCPKLSRRQTCQAMIKLAQTYYAKQLETGAEPDLAELLSLQYTPSNSYFVRQRDLVIGGFRISRTNNEISLARMNEITIRLLQKKK